MYGLGNENAATDNLRDNTSTLALKAQAKRKQINQKHRKNKYNTEAETEDWAWVELQMLRGEAIYANEFCRLSVEMAVLMSI